MSSRYEYGTEDVVRALAEAGLKAGEVAFSHVGVAMLGFPRGERSAEAAWGVIADAYTEALGPDGTWVVPTYSYTLTKPGEVFDLETTPSDVGDFTEYVRHLPGFRRSRDPMFSVAARGPRAAELIDDLPAESFGPDSVYGRLARLDGSICNVGVGFRYATFIHYAERILGVPYRYPKAFTGPVRSGDMLHEETWIHHVRALDDPASAPDLRRLERFGRARGVIGSARVGIGEVTRTTAADLLALTRDGVAEDPWFLTAAGADDYNGPPPRTG